MENVSGKPTLISNNKNVWGRRDMPRQMVTWRAPVWQSEMIMWIFVAARNLAKSNLLLLGIGASSSQMQQWPDRAVMHFRTFWGVCSSQQVISCNSLLLVALLYPWWMVTPLYKDATIGLHSAAHSWSREGTQLILIESWREQCNVILADDTNRLKQWVSLQIFTVGSHFDTGMKFENDFSCLS